MSQVKNKKYVNVHLNKPKTIKNFLNYLSKPLFNNTSNSLAGNGLE